MLQIYGHSDMDAGGINFGSKVLTLSSESRECTKQMSSQQFQRFGAVGHWGDINHPAEAAVLKEDRKNIPGVGKLKWSSNSSACSASS
ncbi:MAG TPA: hypothetical protein VMD27_05750 [Candidatus Aquilonibacter sp.]|nr:hypothetical protein [Candidatus Aquilonibacter sp.]